MRIRSRRLYNNPSETPVALELTPLVLRRKESEKSVMGNFHLHHHHQTHSYNGHGGGAAGTLFNGGGPRARSRRRDSSRDSRDSSAEEMISKEEMETRFSRLVDMMDLPGDKKQAVLQSSDDKKWQMVRDNTRRRYEHPPSEYLSKLSYVMDADGPRKARKRANDPAILQSLQSLEISLRTNNIVWVQDFLSEENGGLKELVKYMSYRCQAEMQLPPPSRGSSSSRLTIRKTKSLDVNSYLESPRHSLRQSSPSSAPYEESSMDIHVCVLCLKALMNNAHGFAAVMKDPDAITRMALSMFYGTHR
ncbi:Formin-like protein 1 [Geodia barretti]|nr:Formin-like protein 1 [Geodia barretti]